jgi:hypothetical protein
MSRNSESSVWRTDVTDMLMERTSCSSTLLSGFWILTVSGGVVCSPGANRASLMICEVVSVPDGVNVGRKIR